MILDLENANYEELEDIYVNMYVHAHMCTCTYMEVAPDPPTPYKNFKSQLLLQATLQHIMCFDVKIQYVPNAK